MSTPFVPGVVDSMQHSKSKCGWRAVSPLTSLMKPYDFVCKVGAAATVSISLLQSSASGLVAYDRECFSENLAYSAYAASRRNDYFASFAVVKLLAGRGAAPDKNIKLESGDIAPTEIARQERWQRHFRDVFSGDIVELADLLERNAAPNG